MRIAAALVLAFMLMACLLMACLGSSSPGGQIPAPTPTPSPPALPPLPLPSTAPPPAVAQDPFAHWNDLAPQPWWQDSEPYSCRQRENDESPWAQLVDLGRNDPLSLIRYHGNGSYLRYGHMGFVGCTPMRKHPERTHLDPPVDPSYYSRGERTILVDLARVPYGALDWQDDGERVDMSLDVAVDLLNTHVAAYYERVSGGVLALTFRAGLEFTVEGDGSPATAEEMQLARVASCWATLECPYGMPGGLDRILLNDVASSSGGVAYNGHASFGLVSLRDAHLETIVHEIGHGWMQWPHSYAELAWQPVLGGEVEPPNPYSNRYDVMSGLLLSPVKGWHADLPPTLAVNRYAAGWIPPEQVALHLAPDGRYVLRKPLDGGHQFLVVHSGRPFAFTTIEVVAARPAAYVLPPSDVYQQDGLRPFRTEGVLVSRYDQSVGTGVNARFGPALHDRRNPEAAHDVGWGSDDYSLIGDGETRDIGGVLVTAARNDDGSYTVEVTGGLVARFARWCKPIWFADPVEYDTGCALE